MIGYYFHRCYSKTLFFRNFKWSAFIPPINWKGFTPVEPEELFHFNEKNAPKSGTKQEDKRTIKSCFQKETN